MSFKPTTKYISTEGLPESVVRALEVVVETLRGRVSRRQKAGHADGPKLPRWTGHVRGELHRSEIYDDRE